MFKLSLRIIFKENKFSKRIISSGLHTTQSSNVELKPSENYTSVADFYSGKSVFITGGSGYLGKVFIEKLLHYCPDLENIYMLIRDKRGVNVNQRVDEVFNNVLFQKLREKRPHALKKVVPIVGDVALPDLGIKKEDQELLKEKVSVVIHSAATLRFMEELKIAVNINIEGTKRVLQLCKSMKNIEALVHISTAYTNSDRLVIDEVVYPPPRTISEVYKFMNEHHSIDELMKFLNGKPNTYTFTKAITEHYLSENHGDVPTCIVRPSIVTGIAKEPLPGWVGNWAGTTQVAYHLATGRTRVALGTGKNIKDLIPVDYVANVSILAATKCKRSDELKVYNSCSSAVNPTTFSVYYDSLKEEIVSSKKNEFPYPAFVYCDKRFAVDTFSFLLDTIPAHIMDLWRLALRKKPMHVEETSRAVRIRDALEFFITGSWVFLSHNVNEMERSLSETDKATFPCAPKDINWKDYLHNFSKGIRTHLLNDK